jgi:hypothetical protein
MVKRFALVGLFFALIFQCAAAALDVFPSSSVNGSTGVVRMPSADVLPYKNFNVGFNYGTNVVTKKTNFMYNMNLGTFQGMELGLTGGTISDESKLREGVFINLKYGLATGTYDNPLYLAIGVENLASYTQADVYMVATRYFKDGPKIHFGFMGDFPGEKFRPLGMLGTEILFGERVLVMADMLAGETIFELNLGLRYYLSSTLVVSLTGLNVTYDEANPKESKDPKSVLFGFTWTNPL